VRTDRRSANAGLAVGLFAAVLGTATAQPGPNLDMAVSGSQVLREELGGGPSDLGSEYQAMLQQLDAMKHQPLRRDALWQRYQAECQSGLDGAPVYSPPLPQ
jgi:glucose-6-phosphate dehydrogenase assembly protein OpcA